MGDDISRTDSSAPLLQGGDLSRGCSVMHWVPLSFMNDSLAKLGRPSLIFVMSIFLGEHFFQLELLPLSCWSLIKSCISKDLQITI